MSIRNKCVRRKECSEIENYVREVSKKLCFEETLLRSKNIGRFHSDDRFKTLAERNKAMIVFMLDS
jgi:hypothetical protein